MARKTHSDSELRAQIRAARQRERSGRTAEPRARSARYDDGAGRIEIELVDGCLFAFPAELGQGLRGATPEQLATVEVVSGGEALRWDPLDADVSVPGLLARLLNVRAWAASYLGRATSEAKAEAARRNGMLGGRPRGGR